MSLLNIGSTALNANQAALSTTSYNISNINTDGYNRQRTEFGTSLPNFEGSHYLGSGVNVESVKRLFDDFLATQVRVFTSQESQSNTVFEFARQVDDLLGSPELSLSSGFEDFFDSVNEVANDPTSIPARQVMLTQADILANRFNTLSEQLSGFKDQVNLNLEQNVKDINNLTKGIAEVNQAILEASSSKSIPPNDLLDQRDQLINELSSLVSVSTIKESDGSVNVFIGSGQAVVVGKTDVSLSIVPNASDPTQNEIGYGPNQIMISNQLSGGSIGGLLTVRNDVISAAESDMDALAASVTNVMNEQHQKGVTLSGAAGGNLFLPTGADAASIRLAITDPRDIAVGLPVLASNNVANTGTAQVDIASIDGATPLTLPLLASNITLSYDATTQQFTITDGVDSATFAYDPTLQSGSDIDLSTATSGWATPVDLSVTVSGVPANGDVITIGNSSANGDNRNALALADLQVAKLLNGNSQSFGDFYGVLVANVATRTQQAEVGQKTQSGLLNQTVQRYESVSGVNLDEEAANLIKFQQSYQAAAQIISVSNTVFNALLTAV